MEGAKGGISLGILPVVFQSLQFQPQDGVKTHQNTSNNESNVNKPIIYVVHNESIIAIIAIHINYFYVMRL